MRDPHTTNKSALSPLRDAMVDFEERSVRAELSKLFAPDVTIRMPHPFGDFHDPSGYYAACYAPLLHAMPDLERRDWIVIAGQDEYGANWVGCAGHYYGTFLSPWLDIPPTGHLTHMRFHEFYRLEEARVVEVQTIWDIPEVMMQANAWPMAPALGRDLCVPAPASGDGIMDRPRDDAQSQASVDHIKSMLECMIRHPSQGGPEVMELPRFWNRRLNWYGPAVIGTCRGVEGFRHWHQIPFLEAMPDRGQYQDQITHHLFGDGRYAAYTGWPNMIQTLKHGNWLGIVPSGGKITLRSLDFWRIEAGKIRENWVLIDILDIYHQLNVDVFARLREFNKARVCGTVALPQETI